MAAGSTKEFNRDPGMVLAWDDIKDSTAGKWMVIHLARGIKKFYQDPENLRGFEEWKKKRAAEALAGAAAAGEP